MSKLRNYCFTLHKETLPTLEFPEDVRYAIWQTEKCPETGRLHYQGYLELAKPMRIVAVKNLLPQLEGAHFEPRRGTRDQARDYCRKAETKIDGPWEHGDFGAGGQGCRTDLLAVKEAIDAGASDLDIAEAHLALTAASTVPLLITAASSRQPRIGRRKSTFSMGPPVRVSRAIVKRTPITPIGNK